MMTEHLQQSVHGKVILTCIGCSISVHTDTGTETHRDTDTHMDMYTQVHGDKQPHTYRHTN